MLREIQGTVQGIGGTRALGDRRKIEDGKGNHRRRYHPELARRTGQRARICFNFILRKTIAVAGSCRYDFWVSRDKSTIKDRLTNYLLRRPGVDPQTMTPRIVASGSTQKDRRRLANKKVGRRGINAGVIVCALLSGCAHFVKISYSSG